MNKSEPINLSEDKIRNKKITDSLISEFKPDYIIASDVYTLWYSYQWSGLDYDIIRGYGIPFGSFDSYEFASTDYSQDYYGGYKMSLPNYMDQCDFAIRYCPLNKPVESVSAKIKFTPLFNKEIIPTPQEIADFNKKFRPTGEEKVIFMANSNWEELNVNRFPALSNMIGWVPKIIMNYLALLEGKITIIHVGPQSWNEDIIKKQDILYRQFNFITPKEFDAYVSCSDAVLSTNLISTTVVKAVFAGVPAVVVQNDKLINFSRLEKQLEKMPAWYQDMANNVKIVYPFRLFPFGWFSFLKPLLKDNPYMDTVIRTSLFQKSKSVGTLYKYLFDPKSRLALKKKQKEYVKTILELPSPSEIIESLS